MTPLGMHPSASWLSNQATEYRSLLEQWFRSRENNGNFSPLVAFILDDEDEDADYKHPRISCERLSEDHTYKARFLQQQCIESNVCFWLARMSSSVDSGYGASTSIFELDTISELDGTVIVKETVLIDKEDVVGLHTFERREANDSDYSEQDSESENTTNHFKDWVCYLSSSTLILYAQERSKPRISHLEQVFAHRGFAAQRIRL